MNYSFPAPADTGCIRCDHEDCNPSLGNLSSLSICDHIPTWFSSSLALRALPLASLEMLTGLLSALFFLKLVIFKLIPKHLGSPPGRAACPAVPEHASLFSHASSPARCSQQIDLCGHLLPRASPQRETLMFPRSRRCPLPLPDWSLQLVFLGFTPEVSPAHPPRMRGRGRGGSVEMSTQTAQCALLLLHCPQGQKSSPLK